MIVVVIWVLCALGVTAIILLIGSWPSRPIREPRRQVQEVYRPALTESVALVAEDDDQVIRDHQQLVEQYKDLIDELYNYGEEIVQRSGRQP